MPAPIIDPKITIGNLIQILVLVVGVVVAYANLTSTQTRDHAQLVEMQQAFVRRDVQEAKDSSIANLLGDISRRLERMERKIDSK